MLEALWSVEFISSPTLRQSAGVVVLESSKAFGGDSGYFYVGSYQIVHDVLKAEVKVTHYFGPLNSVFGPHEEFTLKLEGKIADRTFSLRGHLVERPDQKITVQLTKRADLP
jgi:hypothetical protein